MKPLKFIILMLSLFAMAKSNFAQLPIVNGWTQFSASSDSRIIYVSTSDGNDTTAQFYTTAAAQVGANPFLPAGLVQPYRTIAAAAANLRNGYPDWLLLKNGDTFTNQNLGNRTMYGRNQNEPMLVGAYGPSPDRPQVLTGVSHFVNLQGSDASWLAFVGIYAEPHTRTINHEPVGIGVIVPYSGILVEDCHFSKYFNNLVSHEWPHNPNVVTQRNLRVRRSVLADTYKEGTQNHTNAMFIAGVDTLLFEDCLLDHNGWSETILTAVPTSFRHNSYIYPDCQHVSFINNIVSRGGCTGGGLRGGGYVYNNLFLSNPVNLQFGTAENTINWPTQYASGEVAYNVVLDSRSEAYTPGWGIQVRRVKNTNVHHNIIAHFTDTSTNNVGILTDEIENVSFYNNIVYKWGNNGPGNSLASGIKVDQNVLGTNTFNANDIQMENTYGECVLNYHTGNSLVFTNNRYHNVMPANFWFNPGGTFAGWVNATGETGGAVVDVPYVDPERNITSYLASINASGGLADFLNTRKAMHRANWDTNYVANTVNQYIREGFNTLTLDAPATVASSNELSVFPNPSNGDIFVSASENIIRLQVFNLLGEEINVTVEASERKARVRFTSKQEGIYMLRVETKSGIQNQKIIFGK